MRTVGHKLFSMSFFLAVAVLLAQPVLAASASTSTAAAEQASSAPAAPSAGTIVDKNIQISKIANSGLSSKGTIDITFALANTGKNDDALTAAESDVTDKLAIFTGAEGKETESPTFHVDIPAGKSAALEAGKQVLRLSDVAKTVKDGSHITVTLHFRSAPNANLDIVVHKKSSSWFGGE